MTKPILLSVCIPFPGFYSSDYSGALDMEEERDIEYELEEREDGEKQYPPELRLNAGELMEVYMGAREYRDAYRRVAEWYVDAFADEYAERYAFVLSPQFEEMTSPREYNFETDRLFAKVRLSVLRAMLKASAEDGHKTLGEVISDRFTSRSGFCSHYTNRLSDWLDKPLRQWDHNETQTLLIATAARLEPARSPRDEAGLESDEFRNSVYERVFAGNGEESDALDGATDWAKLKADKDYKRAEKLEAWRERDPAGANAYENRPERDTETPDLFEGAQ